MNKQKICRLSDVVEIVNDNEYNPINAGITKYVAGGHMKAEQLYVTKFGSVIEDKEVIGSAFHKLFKKGHILCGTRFPNLKKVGIATFDGLCANTTLVLQRKNNSDLIDGLLPFILQWDQFTEHAIFKTVGSTNPYVRWRDLANFRFVLPSTSEQIKLKELFWTIQNSIDRLEDLFEKTKNYANSRRELLLTRGIGHTKFKKVEWFYGKHIELPEDWELQTLDKCSKKIITYGIVQAGPNLNSGVPYFRTLDLTKNSRDPKNLWKTSHEISNQYKRTILSEGDIIITVRASIGDVKLVTKEFESYNISRGVARISPSNKLDNLFLCEQLKSNLLQKQFSYFKGGTTFKDITMNNLRKLKIFIPSLEEQRKIKTIIKKFNEQITQQQSHLTNLKGLRRSILNSKLTKEEANVAN